jgi:hypothetical protein
MPKTDPDPLLELAAVIEQATRTAVTRLFEQFPCEDFYYLALVTTGEAHPPIFIAWSQQALLRASNGDASAIAGLKWNHAETPYFAFADDCFDSVRSEFLRRPAMDPFCEASWEKEYRFRIGAMVHALKRLDSERLFGTGQERLKIYINVEVQPPDSTNTDRALALNPRYGMLESWLNEASENLQV